MPTQRFKIFILLSIIILSGCSSSDSDNPDGYTIGGSVSGLVGSITISALDQRMVITRNGNFSFSRKVDSGTIYEVEILDQPVNQLCSVGNATGSVSSANISNVYIQCSSNNSAAVSLSGTISPEVRNRIDSDINDPQASPNISNNSFNTPQVLENFSIVNGFATATGTNRTGFGDRFEAESDLVDIYRVNLQAAQTIRLQVIDFEAGEAFQGDLDLILFDQDLNEIGRSASLNEFESVTVPASDTYYIQVFASSGASKYVLNLDPVSIQDVSAKANTVGTTRYLTPRFKPNEAIIKFKNTDAVTAAYGTSDYQIQSSQFNTSPGVNNGSLNRSVLTRLNTMQGQSSLALADHFTQETPVFLSELLVANPESYQHYTTLQAIKKLNQQHDIEFAEPNYIRTIKQVPNDTYYTKQWHYPALNLPQAWDLSTGSSVSGDVIVAVIDTGVYLAHPEFSGQLVPGYDFISDVASALDGNGIDTNPDDPGDQIGQLNSSWHGTHVAGTIAARTNNNSGVAGIAWDAKIMPLRVLGNKGEGTEYDIMQAALYAAGLPNDSLTVPDRKADVINLSLGGSGGSVAAQEVIDQIINAGVIVVAAAGNENSDVPSYPAAYEGVISVSATDIHTHRAPYSNFGNTIDIAAPGGNTSIDTGVLSTLVDDSGSSRQANYAFYQGTSMATPHVAGVIALMRAVHPDLSPGDLNTLLITESLTNDIGAVGKDALFGHGIIDALKAVRSAQALANNGELPELPPIFTASPSSLNFGFESSATLVIANEGSVASIISVNNNADWLTVSANDIDANGLGSYLVSVDRSGLNDSSYSGKITFNLSTGKTIEVQVSMIVGTLSSESNLGNVYILLIDSQTDDVVDQTLATENVDGLYSYQFDNVVAGNYQILGGSDIDNDYFICQLGESCGGYPVTNRLSNIQVTNENINSLDFVAGILSTIGTSGVTVKSNASNSEPLFPIAIQRSPAEKTIGVVE